MFTMTGTRGRRVRRIVPFVESLEPRLAPATFVNATTVTYQDVDGDSVTIRSSRAIFSALNLGTVLGFDQVSTGNATPQQLQFIDLTKLATPASASGTALTITAARDPIHGGDGFVNVGFIDATGIDLGAVTIHGDLGRIDAGDANANTAGLAALSVQSMGRFSTVTQASTPAPSLVSNIVGELGILTVNSDVVGATINVSGGSTAAAGQIGSITIGNSLRALSGQPSSGTVTSSGNIGPVLIGGDIIGGDSNDSGAVLCGGALSSISVNGSVRGGAGNDTGEISSQLNLGPVIIQGNVLGGAGNDTGEIDSQGNIKSVTITGSLVGGAGSDSGEIDSSGNLGKIHVGGNIIGGGGSDSGEVQSINGTLASITVGGSLIGGGSGANSDSGEVFSAENMGNVVIKGDIRGGGVPLSGAVDTDTGNIASVTVGGSVLGGTGSSSGLIDSGGNIGPILIGGDVRGSDALDTGLIENGLAGTVGTFANITVLGSVIGGGGQDSGVISSLTDVGVVDIGQGLVGGNGEDSGEINTSGGSIAEVLIGGSITGGSGTDSGEIDNLGGSILAVAIGGSVVGSSGTRSGEIDTAGGDIGSVTIGGSLMGGSLLAAAGTATGTGAIIAGGSLGAVTIGVNLVGGSITGSNVINLAQSGYITGSHIKSVTVGGSVISGSNTNTGAGSTLTQDGSIRASQAIGSIIVNGNLTGNATNPVIISAVGQAVVPVKAKADVAIGKLTVGGRVESANILAGYAPATNGVADGSTAITGAVNGQASIGTVKVKGDWLQSNLVAGVQPGADDFFGTADDTEIGAGALIASIASIRIGGQALGTLGGNDHFGFVAKEIAAFSLGGTIYKLKKGAGNDGPIAIGTTGDLTLLEVV